MTLRDLYLSVLLAAVAIAALFATTTQAETLAQRLSGKILLQVEQKGEAWYVYPETKERFYLGRPDDAFQIMRKLGLGITNADLALIPESNQTIAGNAALRQRLSGTILLQVEAHGEAWYVYPDNLKRYYLGRPDDAFAIMRELGLGISDLKLISIPVSPDSASPNGVHGTDPDPDSKLNDGRDAQRVSVLSAINAERAAKGLPAYTLQHDLSEGAQNQANDMVARDYFAFTSPDGKAIDAWTADAGYDAHTLAENIAKTNGSVAELVSTWKTQQDASYSNVVHADYEHLGVGVQTQNGLTIYTVVFGLSLETYFNGATQDLADLAVVRSEMLARLNMERGKEGLAPLAMASKINLAAQGHAADMFNRAYYGHESPEGSTAFDRIGMTGYEAQLVAENIAKNQFSVTEVMDSWMASAGHRANIMDADFTEVGFGLAYGKSADGYALLWVQNFAKPM